MPVGLYVNIWIVLKHTQDFSIGTDMCGFSWSMVHMGLRNTIKHGIKCYHTAVHRVMNELATYSYHQTYIRPSTFPTQSLIFYFPDTSVSHIAGILARLRFQQCNIRHVPWISGGLAIYYERVDHLKWQRVCWQSLESDGYVRCFTRMHKTV